ncbi:FAD-dependent oxidoreductase [Kitasatospora sp. NPDC089797]|uniref:NAD(P)/FAD-dependent oxidoreductase n=1 Tax=Kitasatospora sp. NPDC089797 TaxID=3155298 RepID=UPI0034479C6C
MTPRIVVAGASLGGLRAAEQLRAAGWRGAVTVVGEEPHLPYNRPPLSKEVLAGKAPSTSLAFTLRASVADVEWRLGTRVAAADLAGRRVVLDGGGRLDFDGLVVATGVRPRRLHCPGPTAGRHTVRTLADAEGLRAELLRPGVRLVVVGAGFIGCEVAATAVGLGVAEVTVVDPEPLPMLRALGELPARELLRRHRERGVRFALGTRVSAFTGGEPVAGGEPVTGRGRVTGVVLADGTELPADVVVESVGSVANTEWLAGNALDLTDGVLTDEHLRVGGLPHVVAVGDVARFPNARYDGVPRRVEHWCIPTDTARHAARTLVAHLHGAAAPPEPFAPLPGFWSDQHDVRLQSFGAPALGTGDVRVLDRGPNGDVLVGYHRDGRLVGVLALGGRNVAAAAARHRAELLAQPTLAAP